MEAPRRPKNMIYFIFVLCMITILLSTSAVAVSFSGGSGDLDDPFQISTVEQLQQIGRYPGSHYVLINDIDASSTRSWNNGDGFEPIGDSNYPFSGSLNGSGYNITGLYINMPYQDDIAPFKKTYWATIENVGLVDVEINGNGAVGGLCSQAFYTVIDNCFVTGNVTGRSNNVGGLTSSDGIINNSYFIGNVRGSSYVGGLVSNCDGNISNSYVIGNVTGSNSDVGGLVGTNAYGNRFDNCYTNVDVSGVINVGGLIGNNRNTDEDCIITNCSSQGNITVTGYQIGGLIGYNDKGALYNCSSWCNISGGSSSIGGLIGYQKQADVVNCSSEGTIVGGSHKDIGGLVGYLLSSSVRECNSGVNVTATGDDVGGLIGKYQSYEFKNCYATGSVSGSNKVGGLVGDLYQGTIMYCYARGDVNGSDEVGGLVGDSSGNLMYSYSTGKVTGSTNTGGLIGNGFASNSFWDNQTSEMTTSAGGYGRNTAGMKTESTYTDYSWDFSTTWSICYNSSSS